jgi:hypothetical protein
VTESVAIPLLPTLWHSRRFVATPVRPYKAEVGDSSPSTPITAEEWRGGAEARVQHEHERSAVDARAVRRAHRGGAHDTSDAKRPVDGMRPHEGTVAR